jgi:tetratricopeptide (TPR) repeat protein
VRARARARGRAADAAPPRCAAAVEDFGAAIAAMPEYGDAWKRRGQARAALGQAGGALADFGRAVALTAEPGGRAEALAERGALLQKGRDLRRAAADLEEAARLNAGSKQVAPRPGLRFSGVSLRVSGGSSGGHRARRTGEPGLCCASGDPAQA